MHQAKRCEEELRHLLIKYTALETKYKEKIIELEKCRHTNKELCKEVEELRCALEECRKEKDKLQEEVKRLYLALEACKKNKAELLKIIIKLEEKNQKIRT